MLLFGIFTALAFILTGIVSLLAWRVKRVIVIKWIKVKRS